ncbi:MAG: hypothetical protein ACD_19C00185G0003 [uncultured bacterium]|nr:MAG: hypothetical protein ACD_19C00185G0003 [uncultured bacterium]
MPTTELPLVDVKVTNPVTYLRLWWQKVIGNEGVSLSVKIHPLTAIAIGALAFGAGKYTPDIPFLNYKGTQISLATQSPEPIWKETAFTGKLQYSVSNKKYFLLTASSEAITLEVPNYIDLLTLVGKRIMAVGEYNKSTKVLRVSDAKNLEILSKTPQPIPTFVPTIEPSATPSITPIETPTEIPLDSPAPTD